MFTIFQKAKLKSIHLLFHLTTHTVKKTFWYKLTVIAESLSLYSRIIKKNIGISGNECDTVCPEYLDCLFCRLCP